VARHIFQACPVWIYTIISYRFDKVPQYGKGKTNFKTASVLTQFVQQLIFRGFLKENVREMEDRVLLTYLTLGNVTDLLNDKCRVFFKLYLNCSYHKDASEEFPY
jgi:hypothetical protein